MLRHILILIAALVAIGCHHVKDDAKNALHKTGETAGKVGTEIVNSVSEGVKQALECEVHISDALKAKGIQTGKLEFASNGGTDNVLNLYLIFNDDFNGKLNIKVIDEKGLEYGRSALQIKAAKGSAGYYDFTFDNRTNLEGKSTFTVE